MIDFATRAAGICVDVEESSGILYVCIDATVSAGSGEKMQLGHVPRCEFGSAKDR